MSHISVKFVDFWASFNPMDNKFVSALKSRHNVRVLLDDSDEQPDLLFFSRSGNSSHLKYDDCIKIYYTGENDVPNFNECDYAISFHNIDFGERHLRYPLYMFYEYDEVPAQPNIGDLAFDREFCSFLMRNNYNCDRRRLEIVDAIESYKPIAYGGPFRNNKGYVAEKIPFIKNYKFNLALENSSIPGYITEKILEPFVAATVPIYWGASDIANEFNQDAFINVSDYNDMSSFLNALKRIDTDKQEYLNMLRTPALHRDIFTDFDSQLANFLDNIVVCRKRHLTYYGEVGRYHYQNKLLQPFVNSQNFMRIAKVVKKLRRM